MKSQSFTEKWSQVRRLLVIRMDDLGDMVMLAPALCAIRETLPMARISLLASPSSSQVAPLLPGVEEAIPWAAVQDMTKDPTLDPQVDLSLVEDLRQRRFDAAIIFTSFAQSSYPAAYITYLAGIPIRVGYSRTFGGSLLSDWYKPPSNDYHQVDRNLALLERAGFRIPFRQMELDIPPADQTAADTLLSRAGVPPQGPFILLVPGAGTAARRYDPSRFVSVIRMLSGRIRLPLVIAEDSRETPLPVQVLQAAGERHPAPVISLVGQTTLPQFAGLVKRASLVVANNSSAMHMADALRRPMVILFSGSESISQWRPRSASVRLLRRETTCSPCFTRTCPFGMECLEIPPEDVVTTCLNLLSGGDFRQKPSGLLPPRLAQDLKGLVTKLASWTT